MDDQRRKLPSVHEVVEVVSATEGAPRALVALKARRIIHAYREELARGLELAEEELFHTIVREVREAMRPGLRQVINATGVVLHTGLGRAPLSQEAVEALVQVARFCNLQADLEEGTRSVREAPVEELLCELTGCEAATVVNNNAAATLLVLAALAAGREVIVSRGELVEIGGSFRLPEVMAQSGATLVEVGCTNRTHLQDYERAITDRTAALMKVHKSNYALRGFVAEVGLEALSGLARERGLVLIHDMGSGSLVDLRHCGLEGEPTAAESIRQGADVVTFSGDKLLGGPQAGIILGKARLVDRVRAHPLARAVRVDKLALAALEATLRLCFQPDAARRIPALHMITVTPQELRRRATRFARALRRRTSLPVGVRPGVSRVGSGAFPVEELPTWLVDVDPSPLAVEEAARRLRKGHPSVFARIVKDRLALDLRTVFPDEEVLLVDAFAALAASTQSRGLGGVVQDRSGV